MHSYCGTVLFHIGVNTMNLCCGTVLFAQRCEYNGLVLWDSSLTAQRMWHNKLILWDKILLEQRL
jgi:hypothetical protein